MNETNAVHNSDESFPSSVQEQFASAIGKALSNRKNADGAGAPWSVQTVLHPAQDASAQTPAPAAVALRFGGDLAGEVILCLAHEGAALLLGQDAEVEAATFERRWTELLSASQEALIQALEPVFGTVTLHPGNATASEGQTPLAELRIQSAGTAEEAAVRIFLDTTLAVSLERLAAATRALSNDAKPAEDRDRLHRVIDVPLTVTLRFGQRQMTLRELLALSTGSLVELDRQVEEPVELMLGERVVARGEVVIVDGNYGMRVIEVIEGAGTRAAPSNL